MQERRGGGVPPSGRLRPHWAAAILMTGQSPEVAVPVDPPGLYGEKDTARAAEREEQGSSSVGIGTVPAARHSGAVSAPLPPRRAARRAWARRSAAVITPAPVPCDHAPVRPLVDSPAGRAATPIPLVDSPAGACVPAPPASFTRSTQRTTTSNPARCRRDCSAIALRIDSSPWRCQTVLTFGR